MDMLRTTAVLAALTLASAVFAADHEIRTEYRNATLSAVEVENLVGAVKVLPAEGKELLLEYRVVARGSSAAEVLALAQSIKFRTDLHDGRVTVHIDYPLDDHRSYLYTAQGSGYETNTEYQGRRVRVTSRGGREAVDLHVDITAHVPQGFRARFKNSVGEIGADGVSADLDFDTGSGGITAHGNRGTLRADTGSGAVSVRDHQGDIDADTGSGEVEIIGAVGDISADTGSGEVTIRSTKSKQIKVDTGSGRVLLEDSSGTLDVDTGSGGVIAKNFVAGERLRADTGSGGVRVEGDLSALRDIVIDTGSGGATLVTSKPLDLRLEVDAGSGGISVEMPNMHDVRDTRDDDGKFSATLGSGRGRASVDTGSGGVSIMMSGGR